MTLPVIERRGRKPSSLRYYRIDGEPLPMERQFQLRLLDFVYGYKSVKGLHRLEITLNSNLINGNEKAGYLLSGEIQPKRYRTM